MSSFLKSALNYVNNYNSNDDFVGSNVDLGQQKLYVSSIIAEGIFFIGFLFKLLYLFLLQILNV